MVNILVTGGAGYIGSILVPELLTLGHKVTVVDNFMYDQTSLNSSCFSPNLKIHSLDVRSPDMTSIYAKNDVIFPLAALVGAPLCNKDPIGAKTINTDSVYSMLNVLSNDQQVIMPTTNSAYGTGDENNFCTEESPLNPISNYAIEKVEIEKALMERENVISYRLATVFGMSPRMRMDLLVNDFAYRAFKDKFIVLFESHFKRNYIHVRDVVSSFVHGLDNFENMKSHIFNVGLSSANISKLGLCEKIKLQVPDFVIVEEEVGTDPDQRDYIVSNEKIEKTGFVTEYSLDDGVRELLLGYKTFKQFKHGNI
jgi:nucleoside-diphosphate-sugar epimerase